MSGSYQMDPLNERCAVAACGDRIRIIDPFLPYGDGVGHARCVERAEAEEESQ